MIGKLKNYIRSNGLAGAFANQCFRIRIRLAGYWHASKFRKTGRNFRIEPGSSLTGTKFITVGDNFYAGKCLRLQALDRHWAQQFNPGLTIGNNVNINDYVHIGCCGSITIGNNVLIASKVFISDHSHGNYSGPVQDSPEISPMDRQLVFRDVYIEDNVWIGENVVILPGVHIGKGAVIGANSLVNKNVPANSVGVGSPVKIIKQYNGQSWT